MQRHVAQSRIPGLSVLYHRLKLVWMESVHACMQTSTVSATTIFLGVETVEEPLLLSKSTPIDRKHIPSSTLPSLPPLFFQSQFESVCGAFVTCRTRQAAGMIGAEGYTTRPSRAVASAGIAVNMS